MARIVNLSGTASTATPNNAEPGWVAPCPKQTTSTGNENWENQRILIAGGALAGICFTKTSPEFKIMLGSAAIGALNGDPIKGAAEGFFDAFLIVLEETTKRYNSKRNDNF